MEKNSQTTNDPHEPEKDPGYRNILKMILLAAILVGSWFLLEWLMNGR